MKTITLLLCFFTISSYAQLEVQKDNSETIGEVGPMGQTTAKITKHGEDYLFLYQDLKYTQITDFKSFEFNSLDDFYNFLIKGLDEKRKDEEDITLDGNNLTVDFNRFLGVGTVEIYHKANGTIGVTTSFTKNQIDRLFGK